MLFSRPLFFLSAQGYPSPPLLTPSLLLSSLFIFAPDVRLRSTARKGLVNTPHQLWIEASQPSFFIVVFTRFFRSFSFSFSSFSSSLIQYSFSVPLVYGTFQRQMSVSTTSQCNLKRTCFCNKPTLTKSYNSKPQSPLRPEQLLNTHTTTATRALITTTLMTM